MLFLQGAGKMGQQLVLAALAEDLGSFPSTHMWLTNACNSSSRGFDALF